MGVRVTRGRPKTHVRGATPGELASESSRGFTGLGSGSGGRGVLPGWLRKWRPGERLRVPSAGTASTDRRGGVVEAIRAESECVRTE